MQKDEVFTPDQDEIDNNDQRRLGNLKNHYCQEFDKKDPQGILVWHEFVVPRIRGAGNAKKNKHKKSKKN